ncbi:MAG: hypothetical protein AUJ39_01100 [Parcubacteria group bacterium CG1_02_42_13]|uniref:DegT/DnrJ/EryC1/StrS aminotransferase n=1 Tax=Candidatus Colwellbacteria bacterium CG23_combo_of_CG06-09_8_20_14_all_42_19 TaxID=1974541 RepID=A0A2H0ALR1_9BACT|nr:MAG: hypothetical protein AUJ39_01100 [Parcubacteria group bacterium CG1_02_42_13]PIP46362.1 MAG: hypothetical protein COX15_00850 [Candidatus Colwellbacteria bacterium CG23_combo_of_CG06-09_8_20_14_all_42_19]
MFKNIFTKPIFISISPTAEKNDIILALKLLLQPWKWKSGESREKFKSSLAYYLGVKDIFLFDSGRNALYAILLSLNLKEGDEILIQAFTCTAAVNPILWLKARPVYVDVSTDGVNMLPKDVEKKITLKTKAIIVQHTFGFSAEMDEILKIAKKHKLAVIEDVAHAFGGKYKRKMLGTLGDAAILSFGRSKIISSVSGGAAVVNNKAIAENLEAFYRSCRPPKARWVAQQLLHPIIFGCVKLSYNFLYFGRILALTAKVLRLYTPSVCKAEKKGGRPPLPPSVMPNALAALGLNQLDKLDRFNEHRIKVAKIYEAGLKKNKKVLLVKSLPKTKSVFLYFPVAFENSFISDEFLLYAKRESVYLEVWPARTVIGPPGTSLNKLFYIAGSCPSAESLALRSIVLPTSPLTSYKDALEIVNLINTHAR